MQSLKGRASTATFNDLGALPQTRAHGKRAPFKSNVGRTAYRVLEQSAGTVLYDLR
jgi:hypothetical protein